MAELLYQGHGSYRIVSNEGVVIYVDPYAGEGYEMPADIVIVTHEHSDHNQVDLVTLKDDGVILRHGDLFVDGEYPIKKIKKVMIEGTPAENKNHTREECVGFIMTVDGITLYGAGDTNYYPEMESFNDLDYSLLPVDGIYNMSAQEASRCAHVIDSRYFIPIHTSPTQLYDEDIAKSFKSPHALYIKPGERLKL
ncbi:MBL fold metallo-hydrolase [Catenibacterium sp.]|uniref:MBL fold metallo-hydrolase n=1 Tax=Catenibacterium sp. TaxID=2049022 RepID=UPI004026827D